MTGRVGGGLEARKFPSVPSPTNIEQVLHNHFSGEVKVVNDSELGDRGHPNWVPQLGKILNSGVVRLQKFIIWGAG